MITNALNTSIPQRQVEFKTPLKAFDAFVELLKPAGAPPAPLSVRARHLAAWRGSRLYRIVYIVLSILTLGLLPLVHLGIVPFFVKPVAAPLNVQAPPKWKAALGKIQTLVAQNPFNISYYPHLHELHDKVTELTLEVRQKPELKKVWNAFLDALQGKTMTYVDGTKIVLDVSREKMYLEHPETKPGPVVIEQLNSQDARYRRDLEELNQIDKESFGKMIGIFPSQQHVFFKPNSKVFLARDAQSREVLGLLWSRDASTMTESSHYIWALARKADAAKRGVAHQLFDHYLTKHVPSNYQVKLHVREGNGQAQQLYSQYGFQRVRKIPFYPFPTEDAWVMVRPGAQPR